MERESTSRGAAGVVFSSMAPSGRNKVLVWLGFGLGAPWIIVFTAGSVAAPFLVPEGLVREAVLGAIIVNLLFGLVHILAAAGVWLAFYNINGSEELVVDADRISVRRRALRFTVPIKLTRTGRDVAQLLNISRTPGRVAHPKIEIRAGDSAMRFGAGMTMEQAAALLPKLNSVLEGGSSDESRS